jgi:hypothetical protein
VAFQCEVVHYTRQKRKFVLHAKYEFGLLGYFDEHRKSPLEGFKMGGDGMSGYDFYGSDNIALRGYANGSITPTSGNGRTGNIYAKTTIELRYPITLSESANIYALSFLEAGNSWYDFNTFNVFDLKRSAVLGVRFWLPMFGLRGIDWGYGFDKPNNGFGFVGQKPIPLRNWSAILIDRYWYESCNTIKEIKNVKIMKRIIITFIAVAVLSIASYAQKYAFVDTEYILGTSRPTKQPKNNSTNCRTSIKKNWKEFRQSSNKCTTTSGLNRYSFPTI